jgi:hypothetical protein
MANKGTSIPVSSADSPGEEKKKTIVYLIIFLIIAFLVLGGILYWYFCWDKNEAKTTATPSKTATATPTPDKYQGYSTLNNDEFGYSIKYPSGAKISYADKGTLEGSNLSEKVCVNIKTAYGYVAIESKAGMDAMVLCLRTGVGQNYKNIKDYVTIMGEKYEASGMYDDVSEPGKQQVSYSTGIDSGTGLEYGTLDYYSMSATNPTFNELIAELKLIVESYQEK